METGLKIEYFKSNWEVAQLPIDAFASKVRSDGFDGAEVYLAARAETASDIRAATVDSGIQLIAQVITEGSSPIMHIDSFARQVDMAVACGACAINSHTGSDFFPFDKNVELFEQCDRLARSAGLPLWHETHRGRALFNLPDTIRFLDALPHLEIVADISHFMTVHESHLEDRWEMLRVLLPRIRHVHARVGFMEGPQVSQPLLPEWEPVLNIYLRFWTEAVQYASAAGMARFTITPEAGPPPYMPTIPFTNLPLADAWHVNVQMRDHLRAKLKST